MMALDRGLEFLDPLAAARREVVFVDVGSVQNRLCGEQPQCAQELDRVGVYARFARAAPRVELLDDALEQDELELRLLVARARRLSGLVEPALDHGEIGQGELARDDVVIAHGIDGAHDVHHVRIVEAADHMDDRVDLAMCDRN